MIRELDALKKKGDLLFNIIYLTKELDGPSLLVVRILSSKEKLIEKNNVLKVSWENKFIETIEFSEAEVERWLVRYININDEVNDMLHQ
jgi:hypothetical protein